MKASGDRLVSFADDMCGVPVKSLYVFVVLYRADPLVPWNEKAQAPGSLVVRFQRSRIFVVAEGALIRLSAITRKIVNYAWRRRSPRKLWWKSVAVVTCKSMVSAEHRGERPIELSSSWFRSKFLSG